MPSDAELRDLLAIALKASPPEPRNYADEQVRETFFREFKQVFAALGEIGRTTEINHERGAVHWLEKARDICGWSNFEFRHFWLAMLAHGDILYQDRDESAGIVPALALASYGGIPAVAAWRNVLARGAPSPPTKPIGGNYPAPPVRITQQLCWPRGAAILEVWCVHAAPNMTGGSPLRKRRPSRRHRHSVRWPKAPRKRWQGRLPGPRAKSKSMCLSRETLQAGEHWTEAAQGNAASKVPPAKNSFGAQDKKEARVLKIFGIYPVRKLQ